VKNRFNILIADDDESMRKMVSVLLNDAAQARHYILDLAEARDGAEALQKLREGRFDILALDIRMPKLDGFEVLKCIRSFPSDMKPKVFIITSWPEAPELNKLVEQGDVKAVVRQPLNSESIKIVFDELEST
jgi:two-component system chemotaxis response regulator CheY